MSTVVLYPGYLTGPYHLSALKKRLLSEGHIVEDWAFGYNMGMSDRVFDALDIQLIEMKKQHGSKITIIGHSLGGSIGRTMGNISGKNIEQVITIGSPIHNIRAALDSFKLTLDAKNGKTTNPEEWEQYKDTICDVPKLKCTSIWSTEDRTVPWQESLIEASDGNNISVAGSHLKLPQLPAVQDIVSQLLVEEISGQMYNIRT